MRKAAWMLVAGLMLADASAAQQDSLAYQHDLMLLRQVYAWEAPAVTVPLVVVNRTSYPVFALMPLAVYAAEGAWQPAARMAASEAAAGLLVLTLKNTVRRPRPYAAHPGLPLRSDRVDQAVLARDSYGFPSGHAAFAFAAATSLSLTHPEWYVVIPAQAWAGAVAVARLWHGAHYPSDVLAGAALGFVAAGAVHVLWPDARTEHEPLVLPVRLRMQF